MSRRHKIPTDWEQGLNELIRETDAWLSRSKNAWFHLEKGVFDETVRRGDREVLPDLFDDAISALADLEVGAKQAKERLRKLRQFYLASIKERPSRTVKKTSKAKR